MSSVVAALSPDDAGAVAAAVACFLTSTCVVSIAELPCAMNRSIAESGVSLKSPAKISAAVTDSTTSAPSDACGGLNSVEMSIGPAS